VDFSDDFVELSLGLARLLDGHFRELIINHLGKLS